MRKVLFFVRQLLSEVPDSEEPYTVGFKDALLQIQEYCEDQLWQEGEG